MQYNQCGPWGVTLDEELSRQSRLNASFSQYAWEEAKQNGCLPCPGRSLPKWPPTGKYIYPEMSKVPEVVLGACESTGMMKPYTEVATGMLNGVAPPQILQQFPQGAPEGRAPIRPADIQQSNDVAEQVAQSILQGRVPTLQTPGEGCGTLPGGAPIQSPPEAYTGSGSEAKTSGPVYSVPQAEPDCDEYTAQTMLPCIWNSLMGIGYDLKHWDELPPPSSPGKLSFVFMRDDRPFYMSLLVIAILLAVVFIQWLMGRNNTVVIKR